VRPLGGRGRRAQDVISETPLGGSGHQGEHPVQQSLTTAAHRSPARRESLAADAARRSRRPAEPLVGGVRRRRERPATVDAGAVHVLLARADVEQAAGRPRAARANAAAAVANARTWSLDDPALADLRVGAEATLATLDMVLGDLSAAERRLRAALAGDVARSARAVLVLVNALGVAYKFAGRLDDAQRCYDQVYELLRSSPETCEADLAVLFHNLAGLAHARGDVVNGIVWARRGIEIRATLPFDAEVDLARDYAGLGALQHRAGRLHDAESSYARAESVLANRLGPEHYETGVVLANRASLAADRGDAGAARELGRRAFAVLSAALGRDHPEVARVRDMLLAFAPAR
jgi:tetratricopeptide (TPR) repeat protein